MGLSLRYAQYSHSLLLQYFFKNLICGILQKLYENPASATYSHVS